MSDRWSLPRSTASAAIFVELAGEYGVPAGSLLAGTGIELDQLVDPEGEIKAGQELLLVQELVARLGHVRALGLDAGTRYHASTHGVWGWAVISSPTARRALDVGVRYSELSFSFADFRLDDVGRDVHLTLDDSETPTEVRGFLMERDLAATVTIARDLLGVNLPMKELHLASSDRGYGERFQQLCAATPIFGAKRTTLVLAGEVLDLPLPQSNPQTALLCERQCAEVLQRRHARLGLAGQVRDLLVRRAEITDQDDVAREIGVSVRTLQRQLAEEGTSFRELAGEVNCLLAEELLGAGLAVEDVAHRLGYATASSLTHAYRRWRGITPGQYARTVRAGR
ncbi:AraC family transcriptional regulator [Nocardioides sp. WS12]|uniref:AraC family transcriptional regulator n=1 Tax=Nocardioides sp. WS12 TaxID=2486272 RepID=UPI0015FA884C|nr:AraC family transcriptional regulator [Nocardioides sp. WS12]